MLDLSLWLRFASLRDDDDDHERISYALYDVIITTIIYNDY